MKNFQNWLTEDVEISFGLSRVKQSKIMADWLNTSTTPIDDFEKQSLEKIRIKIENNTEIWNEDELKFFAISQLVSLVEFEHPLFKPFLQRPLSAKINDIELGGKVDFMVASGKQRPREPYFFIHEYKQEKHGNNDPLGQLLSAMVVAAFKNAQSHPLYGCYVLGRFWFFVILDKNIYEVSPAYDASQQGILSIYGILKNTKQAIEKLAVD